MGEVLLRLRVKRAWDLPKTDAFSLIDPFFKLETSKGEKFETKHAQDDGDPVFDDTFLVHLPCGLSEGTVNGKVSLSLFDQETFSSRAVGECELDFSKHGKISEMQPVTLEISVKDKFKKKGAKPAMVELAVEGAVYSYATMKKKMMKMAKGTLFNDELQRLYVPQEGGKVFLGVEYEVGGLDFKLFQTVPGIVFVLDLDVEGTKLTEVRRRIFADGEEIVPGLVAYSETKLDDVELKTDFNTVIASMYTAEPTSVQSFGELAGSHGWQGSLNFEKATHKLSGVDIDLKHEEIGMPVFNGESIIIADWDKDAVDMKLCALSESVASGEVGYDLTIRGQSITKSKMQYGTPATKFGKYSVGYMIKIDNLPYGVQLQDVIMMRQNLSNPVKRSVQDILGLMV